MRSNRRAHRPAGGSRLAQAEHLVDECVQTGLQAGDPRRRPEHDAECVAAVGGQPDGGAARVKAPA